MRTPGLPSAGDLPRVIILPWLPLDRPAEFAGVRVLPRADAIERARSFRGADLSEHVKFATSYFGSGWRYPRSFDLPQDSLTDDDVQPELVVPSVIFVEGGTTLARVDDVIAALNFACMAANDEGRYTNAVVFERYLQTLALRPEYVVPASRQMYGSKTTGTRAINLLATRPHRCGDFQEPDAEHWDAMLRAMDEPSGARIMEAVRKLMAATQDLETIPEDLERSLYAIALERLLALTKTEKKKLRAEIVAERLAAGVGPKDAAKISDFEFQAARARQLLLPLLGSTDPSIEFGYHVVRGLHAIRRERNGVWHAERRAADLYDFEKQGAVRLNVIWFRVTQALIVASLVEAGFADPDGKLALAALAVEAWLSFICEADARDPAVASAANAFWSTARVCSDSILLNRATGAWRAYFSKTGDFVLPQRALMRV
jgi:hypothetical protein